MGFDVSAQNIFNAQTNVLTKMGSILQRISRMAEISCSSGQLPSVRVAMMAMDTASEPVNMDFTDDAESLLQFFRNLRTNGPFVLNGKTISMYTNRFKARQGVTKVRFSTQFFHASTLLDCPMFFFLFVFLIITLVHKLDIYFIGLFFLSDFK